MADIRQQKLAHLLVNYSTSVQPGEWVGLLGNIEAMPVLRYVYEEVLKAGGYPSLILNDEYMDRAFYRLANDAQIEWLDPMLQDYYEKADVYIRINGAGNTRAMTNIPAKKVQQVRAAQSSFLDTRLSRAAEGTFKWVGTRVPTEAAAQEANMSLEEYEDFVYGACFCDYDDPAEEWRKLSKMQQGKVDYLKGKKNVVLKGPNIDLKLGIEGRTFMNSDGKRNMPSGEIFTGPVEDSVNGWVRFTYPSIVGGRAVSGIELRFEEGKVVDASAEQNEELLFAQLDTDAGSRYLGEFAVGTNFGIDKFTGSILFDEKIGGTIHMAVGKGYPETGSKNNSAVHWDMICDMRQDSEIHVDGELFYKNGAFTV
ncbi:aminopeptidase [Phototrophicus methaneseepsis]|uniref:Aminopeptidase n=1 Tax=Phototrophicus methaneseepsis TaxID=2710758 RepID=A0A7S8E5G5_9CHLR|nr:aminopeptidase [Phototrophicus methaneseepsis]QPC80748.1 aminopeptidase [Phototrophicus methaneseepsis]